MTTNTALKEAIKDLGYSQTILGRKFSKTPGTALDLWRIAEHVYGADAIPADIQGLLA